MENLYLGLGSAAAILSLVAVLTHPDRRSALSFLLGASAGLVGVQIFRIHAFTILAVIWLCVPQGAGNRNSAKFLAPLGIAAVLFASTALLGDLVNSPTLALQLLGLVGSAAIVVLRSSREDAKAMLWGLLVVSTIGSAVGLLQVFKLVPSDLWHLQISAVGRPTGIYPEPDWLGMYAGVGVILSWRLSLPRAAKVLFSLTNFMVLVLAMARASWVAMVGTLLLVLCAAVVHRGTHARAPRLKGPRKGRLAAVSAAVLASMIALTAVPQLQEDLVRRISTMIGTVQEDDISGQARIRQNDSLMTLADSVPVYGHGISAAGRVGAWGQIDAVGDSQNNVASNWILGMWVDGAWFAIPLITFLIALALIRLRTIPGQLLTFCLISSLFSNAVFFPITWLLVALAITAGQRLHNTSAAERPAADSLARVAGSGPHTLEAPAA
ncbi:O-antigen ligase [Arthrobacter sp. B2I5]|uniref:O-antigen ligase family protein n=1 Tax=Arthrobacter sp. B2I5 TaxID=3042266 RepID=UPI0027846842|nr:O-antigen ligase family protein [Arthrobacter sp. B2I5]MDQ0827975.1 O-antigen ligase [Arthrobacter sp. B2I5]